MKRKGMRLMVIKDGDDGRSSKGKEKEMKNRGGRRRKLPKIKERGKEK